MFKINFCLHFNIKVVCEKTISKNIQNYNAVMFLLFALQKGDATY